MAAKIQKSDDDWRRQLTAEQYRVARQSGTERPFSGEHTDTTTPGTYSCVCCGAELFQSDAKFDSHCGWPSFFAPADLETVTEHRDTAAGMTRVEVRCAACDAHLGHVFPDGPQPTGLRYCINSVVLKHEPATDESS